MKKEVIIPCSDHCAMVSFTKWDDEDEYFISFYLNYHSPKKSFWAWIKELFKKQNSDLGIVCKQEDIDKLKQFLENVSRK